MNTVNVLNVARALRESPNPERFTMKFFGFGCGTPACALGHYAARRDLQDVLSLTPTGGLGLADGTPAFDGWDEPVVHEHFGLDYQDLRNLFSPWGCGGATTALEAAEYIEHFVTTKDGR